MQKEHYTEGLKFLIEVFRLTWLSILGVGGGLVGLLLGPYDPVRYIWAGAGIVGIRAFMAILGQTYKGMKQIWTHLESNQ